MIGPYTAFKFEPDVSIDTYRIRWQTALETAKDHCMALRRLRAATEVAAYYEDLNDFEVLINGADTTGSIWKALHPDIVFRNEAEKAAKAFVVLKSEMYASSGIAENITLLEAVAPSEGLDAARLLEVWKKNLRQGGAYLKPEAKKEEAQRLTIAIQDVIDEYRDNMRQDKQHLELTLSELYGVPEDYLVTHPINCETGKVRVNYSRSDVGPVLDYCHIQATREKVFRMSNNQASPANERVLRRLLDLRQDRATMLGYENWAQCQLEGTMAKTTQTVLNFLDDMYEVVRPRVQKEIREITELLKDQDNIDARAWDMQYGSTRLKRRLFPGFDIKEMRQYFLVDKVLPAVRKIAEDMFCLRFEETHTPAWHPTVTSYLVFDKAKGEEVLLGRLFFDVIKREGKVDGASSHTARSAVVDRQLAEVILVASLQHQPAACMSLLEVRSILHELGHCVHALVGKQRYVLLAGTATHRDFVEAPSQMLELVFTDKKLFDFAVNAKGERIPDEMLDKLLASSDVGQGLRENNSLVLAHYSLHLHLGSAQSISQIVAQAHSKYGAFPETPGIHKQHCFIHLASANYASLYYCYLFSRVICQDLFSEFEKSGGMSNRTVAMRYRRVILEKGGSEDAEDMVAAFLGRRYSSKAFKEWISRSVA